MLPKFNFLASLDTNFTNGREFSTGLKRKGAAHSIAAGQPELRRRDVAETRMTAAGSGERNKANTYVKDLTQHTPTGQQCKQIMHDFPGYNTGPFQHRPRNRATKARLQIGPHASFSVRRTAT